MSQNDQNDSTIKLGMKKNRNSIDRISNVQHNDSTGTNKSSDGGLAVERVIANSSVAEYVGIRRQLRVVNTTAAIQYFDSGDKDVATPTVTTGFAILPNSVEVFNSGEDEFVRTSDAGVQVVVCQDTI